MRENPFNTLQNIDLPANHKSQLQQVFASRVCDIPPHVNRLVFIGTHARQVIDKLAAHTNTPVIDVEDHEDHYAEETFIRLVKNRFSPESYENMIEIYAELEDDNTDVQANANAVLVFN